MQAPPDRLVVAVRTRMDLDAALDQAVERLMPVATAERVGISVTRVAFDRFEVCLDNQVPPGLTMER